jgi:hypothetical protein
MFYKDNWFTWYYDGIEKGPKTSLDSKFTISTKPTITRKVKNFKEEVLLNASLTRDCFTEPFDLLFSGGADSEIVLRSYHELNIPVNVFIFKYENNYNFFDVSHALRICNELNIEPKVVDFNLQKFFENDAYETWATGYYLSSGQLPLMKMMDYLDNIPIAGSGNPVWIYHSNQWQLDLSELFHSQSIYCSTVKRTAIIDWFEYSPEVILSYTEHPITKDLFKTPGSALKFEKHKHLLYKKFWSTLQLRPKYIGFEGSKPPGLKESKPDFMLDFEKAHIGEKGNTAFSYSNDELVKMLCGDFNE